MRMSIDPDALKRELDIPDRQLFRFAFQYLKNYKAMVILSTVLLVSGSIINLLPELLIRKIIDEDIVNSDINGLFLSVITMAIIYLISYVIRFANSVLSTRTGQGTVYDLREEMFDHLLYQSQSYFDKQHSGRINSKLTNDLDTLAGFFSNGLLDILVALVQLVAIVSLMLFLDLKLALISFAMIPMLIGITLFYKGPIRRISQRRRKTIANVTSSIAENISGAATSKTFAREKLNKKEFERINRENLKVNVRATQIFGLLIPMIGVITAIATASILMFSGYRYAVLGDTNYTVGLVATFMAYLSRFLGPVFTISMFYSTYQSALASLERIYGFLQDPIEIVDAEDAKDLVVSNADIEIQNMHFSYDNKVAIFQDMNILIKGQSVIALVGSTGAGKSSFIKLLNRFYEVDAGSILIDGQDLRDITLHSLRSSIGLVPQTPTLFNTTILDNISYGSDKSIEEIIEVGKLIGIHDFINSLPDKYETRVTEGGKNLSMGQRQLISFARALVKNPKILILDEASSSLDVISEIRVQKALEKLIAGRTVIIIAHRLSTIRKADRILVLEKGKIIQDGDHKTLVRTKGKYQELYMKQFISDKLLIEKIIE